MNGWHARSASQLNDAHKSLSNALYQLGNDHPAYRLIERAMRAVLDAERVLVD